MYVASTPPLRYFLAKSRSHLSHEAVELFKIPGRQKRWDAEHMDTSLLQLTEGVLYLRHAAR
jgi:hypothetical protein